MVEVGPEVSPQAMISVVVPVYNGAHTLPRCLEAITGSRGVAWECIVVDDGSTDDSAAVAAGFGARVVATSRPRSGPAVARNVGAREASAPLLCFIDADVVIREDTLREYVRLFESDSLLAAAFGSYDARPSQPGLVSQYRNLLHHFTHQTGREDASTFWAGCGAIRTDVFRASGGFDEAYDHPCIEDIELGYRLRASGETIRLAKHIQVTHLKRWTLWSVLITDIRDRALPWTALIRRTGQMPDDLNVSWASRFSAAAVFALLGSLGMSLWWRRALLTALAPLTTLVVLNRSLYGFFVQTGGLWFAIRAVPLHWLYYAYSSLAFVCGVLIADLGLRLPFRARGAVPSAKATDRLSSSADRG